MTWREGGREGGREGVSGKETESGSSLSICFFSHTATHECAWILDAPPLYTQEVCACVQKQKYLPILTTSG